MLGRGVRRIFTVFYNKLETRHLFFRRLVIGARCYARLHQMLKERALQLLHDLWVGTMDLFKVTGLISVDRGLCINCEIVLMVIMLY